MADRVLVTKTGDGDVKFEAWGKGHGFDNHVTVCARNRRLGGREVVMAMDSNKDGVVTKVFFGMPLTHEQAKKLALTICPEPAQK